MPFLVKNDCDCNVCVKLVNSPKHMCMLWHL